MELSRQLDKMDAAELRNLTATLLAQLADRDAQLAELDAECSAHAALIAKRDAEIKLKQLKIDQLTHEMATLKRWPGSWMCSGKHELTMHTCSSTNARIA